MEGRREVGRKRCREAGKKEGGMNGGEGKEAGRQRGMEAGKKE